MPADFVIRRSALVGSYHAICSQIPQCKIFYALKANSEIETLRVLNNLNAGFEVASIEEFEKLKSLTIASDRIICSLPVKTQRMIEDLVAGDCKYFVFDAPGELTKLIEMAPQAKKILRIYINDLDQESFKFGIRADELKFAIETGTIDLNHCNGLTFHISRNYRLKNLERVWRRLQEILEFFAPTKPLIINIGGGYRHALPSHLSQKFDLQGYYTSLNLWLADLAGKRNCIFYCEPGRGIVEQACHIECEISLVKERSEKDKKENYFEAFLDLNIGKPPGGHPARIDIMHGQGDLECIYDLEWHISLTPGQSRFNTTFVDTVCEYASLFTLPLKRPLVTGERLRLDNLGAYTVSVCNYLHSRHRPKVRLE